MIHSAPENRSKTVVKIGILTTPILGANLYTFLNLITMHPPIEKGNVKQFYNPIFLITDTTPPTRKYN